MTRKPATSLASMRAAGACSRLRHRYALGRAQFRGVFAFHGNDWRHYLDGLDVNRLGVAPDGSILTATVLSACDLTVDVPGPTCAANPDFDGAGLYVITPEAVEAAEPVAVSHQTLG